jgi:hypothetical protein
MTSDYQEKHIIWDTKHNFFELICNQYHEKLFKTGNTFSSMTTIYNEKLESPKRLS